MFVTFEGTEGSGKSTALRGVAEALRGRGMAVCETREPGAGRFGAAIRELLLGGPSMDPWAEVFLFLADRANHIATVVRPALARSEVVLCDRHADSTVAYQGHARGLPVEKLRELNALATGGLRPDLTILLDLDPKIGLLRVRNPDRLDSEPIEFHERVRAGFLEEARLNPERFAVVDASASPEDALRTSLSHVTEGFLALD